MDEHLLFVKREQAKIELLIQLRQQRQTYAKAAYWIMGSWLFYVATVVIWVGAGWLDLSETVVATLVAGSTANVIGLAGAVTLSLFPRKGVEVPADQPKST